MSIGSRVAKLESKSPTPEHWATCIVEEDQDRIKEIAAATAAYRDRNGMAAHVPVNCIVRIIVAPKERRHEH
jgi:hypothetical protein